MLRDFSPVGRIIYATFGIAFTIMMGLFFWGMAAQRAIEASL